MKFETDAGSYKVEWKSHGWSFAVAKVYKQKKTKFLWMEFNSYDLVWEGTQTKKLVDAKIMLPSEMQYWFKKAISEYEHYENEWEKYNSSAAN